MCIVLLACFSASAADMPDMLRDPHSPWPQWVAADVAVAEDGTLREQMLGQFIPSLRKLAALNTAELTKEGADRSGDPCRIHRGTIPDPFRPTRSLADLTTHAEVVMRGEVLATREGFYGGLPGTLLLLSPRYLKGQPVPDPLLFYPFARIETADGMICGKPLGEFTPPEVGDRVLIFAMGTPRTDNGRAIFAVNVARQLVHEPRTGPLRLPEALRTRANSNAPFAEIERAVTALIDKPSRIR